MVVAALARQSISANLALRLIQLHLCLIYGMAGLAKLQGPSWWNGMAMWGALASAEFRVLDFTWTASYPWLLNVLTHGSLALEIACLDRIVIDQGEPSDPCRGKVLQYR